MLAQAIARQDIEYLRRLYARATDLMGTGEESAVSEGVAIYERIFVPQVEVRTIGNDEPYATTGIQAWADVVQQALAPYVATQHLIGTQLVDILDLEVNSDLAVQAGAARMESHLQAWHEHRDGTVMVFIGTYEDVVSFTPKVGWQIERMTLTQVSGETRVLGQL